MIKKEVIEFCEDYAISIGKFLQDNYELEYYPSKKERRKKKNRLKHDDIKNWWNIVQVPKQFAYRYKELVHIGKLLIVRDDFGVYQVYLNPSLIKSSFMLAELEEELHNIENTPEEYMDASIIAYTQAKIMQLIEDQEENIRLIKHFDGGESLDYTNKLYELIDGLESKGFSRKRVEK